MARFTRKDLARTPANLIEYADRNAAQLQLYVDSGGLEDRFFYGVTNIPRHLVGVIGVMIGLLNRPSAVRLIDAHRSCVQRKEDPITITNFGIYEDLGAIHTVSYASDTDEGQPQGYENVAKYCDLWKIGFTSSQYSNKYTGET